MLTGRSQTTIEEPANYGGAVDSKSWVAKHAQAVWRLLLTLFTRGYYSSCASRAAENDALLAHQAARFDRRENRPKSCYMHPCPTRKDAALRQLCRGGRPKTCQIRAEIVAPQGDDARARATLLIWLQSAWSQARPILWMREGSSISEPLANPTVALTRRNNDA